MVSRQRHLMYSCVLLVIFQEMHANGKYFSVMMCCLSDKIEHVRDLVDEMNEDNWLHYKNGHFYVHVKMSCRAD